MKELKTGYGLDNLEDRTIECYEGIQAIANMLSEIYFISVGGKGYSEEHGAYVGFEFDERFNVDSEHFEEKILAINDTYSLKAKVRFPKEDFLLPKNDVLEKKEVYNKKLEDKEIQEKIYMLVEPLEKTLDRYNKADVVYEGILVVLWMVQDYLIKYMDAEKEMLKSLRIREEELKK